MSDINVTEIWEQYQRGVEYKQRIGLYSEVDENYRYFQGDQWHNVQSNGLPTPVFNIIKPIINYKVANIMATDTKIVYKSNNTLSEDAAMLNSVAEKLTAYAGQLYEKLKLDYLAERILQEAAITANGFMYFYYNYGTSEVAADIIDSTNIYPANPNNANIQEQESIIISFRRSVQDVQDEAKRNGISDVDFISGDSDNRELAGDAAKIEVDDRDMCIVLLKFWRDRKTGSIWFKKSVKGYDIINDTDLGLKYYPIAMMTWENQKNCFFGISEVSGLIPNQDYINTISAMIMSSTAYTAFPKMVYDENVVVEPTNAIDEAIPVNGGDRPLKNIIDYITPGQISSDAFNMFERTITVTKELAGANEAALGNISPEDASGRAIIAVAEQSSIPLESIRRRFYSFLEDAAVIWSDMWRVYNSEGKLISIIDDDGATQNYEITADTFNMLMLSTKIDVGASNKYSEIAVMQTLDNLLTANLIPFEWWVQLQPDSSGIPKAKLMELINQQKQQPMQPSQPPDIDAMLDSMTEQQRQECLQNPKKLEEYIMQNTQ